MVVPVLACFPQSHPLPFLLCFLSRGGPRPAGSFTASYVSWCPAQPVRDGAGVEWGAEEMKKPECFSPLSPPQMASLAVSPLCLLFVCTVPSGSSIHQVILAPGFQCNVFPLSF